MNDLFFALSDKTRRQILEILKSGDLTAGEIANRFQITKPSITHHLNILNQANLVDKERDGQFIRYSLNTTVLQEAIGWILDFVDKN
ncbi:MAG TPA: winged helix-turn-helix transcriptional regulator [Firmicutes bacterium]|nr:winged helix-turn-helix transcriptional regulator [Bacillota bacterium]